MIWVHRKVGRLLVTWVWLESTPVRCFEGLHVQGTIKVGRLLVILNEWGKAWWIVQFNWHLVVIRVELKSKAYKADPKLMGKSSLMVVVVLIFLTFFLFFFPFSPANSAHMASISHVLSRWTAVVVMEKTTRDAFGTSCRWHQPIGFWAEGDHECGACYFSCERNCSSVLWQGTVLPSPILF